jgi:hypothetical protein
MNGVSGEAMTHHPYILFNQSPEELRRIGARGGRAYGRNQRARRQAQLHRPLEAIQRPVPHVETTAEAIAALDAQFAWLRGADKPISTPRRRPS